MTRYMPDWRGSNGEMYETKKGDYVKHDDVLDLENKYSAAIKDIGRLRSANDHLARQNRELQRKKTFSIP